MTREEALKILQREKDCVQQAIQTAVDGQGYVSPDGMIRAEDYVEACAAALTALRPVSREEVEKVWRAHWNESTHLGGFVYCSRCGYNALEANNYTFCPKCGSPFTDEAVEMVMEKMEALYERNDD